MNIKDYKIGVMLFGDGVVEVEGRSLWKIDKTSKWSIKYKDNMNLLELYLNKILEEIRDGKVSEETHENLIDSLIDAFKAGYVKIPEKTMKTISSYFDKKIYNGKDLVDRWYRPEISSIVVTESGMRYLYGPLKDKSEEEIIKELTKCKVYVAYENSESFYSEIVVYLKPKNDDQ